MDIEISILQFNIESFDELETVASIAKDKNMQANIALRVNPDVKAGGHPKISTGKKTDKFGIAMSKSIKAYNFAKDNPYLNVVGVDLHIGSQILNINPFKKAFNRLIKFITGSTVIDFKRYFDEIFIDLKLFLVLLNVSVLISTYKIVILIEISKK